MVLASDHGRTRRLNRENNAPIRSVAPVPRSPCVGASPVARTPRFPCMECKIGLTGSPSGRFESSAAAEAAMHSEGVEPSTYGLRVRCSAS